MTMISGGHGFMSMELRYKTGNQIIPVCITCALWLNIHLNYKTFSLFVRESPSSEENHPHAFHSGVAVWFVLATIPYCFPMHRLQQGLVSEYKPFFPSHGFIFPLADVCQQCLQSCGICSFKQELQAPVFHDSLQFSTERPGTANTRPHSVISSDIIRGLYLNTSV